MSISKTPSSLAVVDSDTDRSPRRKLSTDMMRIKNFPSSLSLRKPDPDASPRSDALAASSTFSRFKAFGQSQRPSRTSLGAEQSDTSVDTKPGKRASRLLDAFKPSKKPPPSFQVVRKPPNRSTTSFHSSSHHPSPQPERQRSSSHLSVHNASDPPDPTPRISLSAPQTESATPPGQTQDAISPRAHYPPSTAKTTRYSNNVTLVTPRGTSDAYLGLGSASNSRPHSPAVSPNIDPTPGSFSLHSFRNVRSTSDVSAIDESGVHVHSRVQSVISIDEYMTPGEELPEPRFLDDNNNAILLDPNARHKLADVATTQSTSPVVNAKPASISAAKFRQASRQRSESGTIPTVDTVPNASGASGASGFVRPPRSRTPSQDLAAMEAILAQTHPRAYRPVDVDRRKSADLVSLPPAVSALNLNDAQSRPKRGFFIVVEGLDRAGKSTQVERLAEHLHAKPIKFPERTTAIGGMINSYLAQTSELDDRAIHLLFSANRWECVASIERMLGAGESVVCDRYAFSGIAYSVAKGLSYDWCRSPDVGLPLPDLTMFLDLDAQTAAARGGYGEERYEKLEFQAKVRDAFARVSQDVRAHGGRWVTIDASKTLDQVTDDIQKAVQRATSSIDRVGAKLGKLFVSERPPNHRAGSSGEMNPPVGLPSVKRTSLSSEHSGRRGRSLDQPRIEVQTATTNASFPVSRPSGSPLTYTEQLSAVRTAAAGTLSGLFGGSNATLDQQNPAAYGEKQQPETDGPSPVNATRGQGFDSARVLAKFPEGGGRRRTLIDVIGEIENQPTQAGWNDRRRSASATAESTSPSLQSATDGFPSTFAQVSRARRSTDHGRMCQLPTIVSSGSQPMGGSHATNSSVSSPTSLGVGDKPLPSPSSFSSTGVGGGAEATLCARSSTLSPAVRTASPAITTSSHSSITSPAPPTSSTSPMQRPASTSPGDYTYPADSTAAISDLNSRHLSMLNVQHGHTEMQEQYMRNYMAMMTNPMLAQQAHYQMMLHRHQQQYYGRAASAIGAGFGGGSNLGAGANGNSSVGIQSTQVAAGPPLAAFMQPSAVTTQPMEMVGANVEAGRGVGVQRERLRSAHKRTMSSGSMSMSTSQPMLSMMMAPPPAPVVSNTGVGGVQMQGFAPQYYQPQSQQQQYGYAGQQQMFLPNGAFPHMVGGGWSQHHATMYSGRAVYSSARSEIAPPTRGLRPQRNSETALRTKPQQPQPQ